MAVIQIQHAFLFVTWFQVYFILYKLPVVHTIPDFCPVPVDPTLFDLTCVATGSTATEDLKEYYSIGATNFIGPYIPRMNNKVEICSTIPIGLPQVNIKIRTVKVKSTGTRLVGWLNVELEIIAKDDNFHMVLLQSYDSNGNAFGEFITNQNKGCQRNQISLENTIVPCAASSQYEVVAPNSIFYQICTHTQPTHNCSTKPIESLSLSFTWRFTETMCSWHLGQRFGFRAVVVTQKQNQIYPDARKNFIYTSPELITGHPRQKKGVVSKPLHYIGVPDPYPPDGTMLDCTEIIPYISSVDENWIQTAPLAQHHTEFTCKQDITSSRDNTDPFSGRCQIEETSDSSVPQSSNLFGHFCFTRNNKDLPHSQLPVENYGSYVIGNSRWSAKLFSACTVKCPPSLMIKDKDDVTQSPPSASSDMNVSIFFQLDSTEYIWSSKQGHAVMYTLISTFLNPTSIILASYYKETYVNEKNRIYGLHPWYVAHLMITVLSLHLHITGLAMIRNAVSLVGNTNQLSAKLHFVIGYVSFVIFLLMLLLGFCRPIDEEARLLISCCHCSFGSIHYLLNLFNIAISTLIPGSPSSHFSVSNYNLPSLWNVVFSWISCSIVVWLTVDLFLRVLLWKHLHALDDRLQIQRRYCPIIIPFGSYHRGDFLGSSFRKKVLKIYILLASCETAFILILVYAMDYHRHWYEASSCFKNDYGSETYNLVTKCGYRNDLKWKHNKIIS